MAIEDLLGKDELKLEEMASIKNLSKWVFMLCYGNSMFIDLKIGKRYYSWVRGEQDKQIRYYKIE